jgi:predicted secreted protein
MKLFALLLFLNACNGTKTESTAQDTLRVKVNERFDIRLGTSMGTGFSWSVADSAYKTTLSLDSAYVILNPEGKDDAPETQVFVFRALQKGETRLHFIHSRPWRKKDPPDKEKKFVILAE